MSIFGPAFVSGAPCLVLLCSARIIDSAVGASGIVILMSGRSKINLINSLILSFLCIGLNYLLIPQHGILGAAAATGASVAIINLLRLIEVYFLFKIHPYKLSFIKPIFSGLIALILTSLAIKFFEVQNPMHFVLVALLFVSLYILSLKVMQLEREEIIILKKIRDKIAIPSPGWLK
jgi:O-antigen/teichoic acid export membrane protein